MYLIIKPYIQELANGEFTANFHIWENYGDGSKTTPYYLNKKNYKTKEQALKAAEKSALNYVYNKYPRGTKYKLDSKN